MGTDAARGKLTYVSVYGLNEARKRARELVNQAVGRLAIFGAPAEPLRALAHHLVERST